MGLRDEITADLAEAFDDDLADAVESFDGVRVSVGEYDPVTERQETVTVSYKGRGVFANYEQGIIDGIQILKTDIELTALQAEVSNAPQIDDKINGFTVIDVGQDPAKVTWSVQLRKV